MRSRIAITALLATGALMSTGGAAIGVTALSTTNDASQAQYGPVPKAPDRSDTLSGGSNSPTPQSGVKNATEEAAAQPARQVEASDESLPFTGYAAIPLLLAGLALLVCGLVLRRRTDGPQLT